MDLHYTKMGHGHPLIILHGLYGEGNNWVRIAKNLSSICEVYLVDQRNHGKSPHSDRHDYDAMAEDLRGFMDRLEMKRAVILGHSMGGKTAMTFAAEFPWRVTKMIIADVSPASYHPTTGESSHQSLHLKIIQTLLSIPLDTVKSVGEVDKRMETRIPDKRVRQFLLKNLVRNADSQYEWQLNLLGLLNNLDKLMDGINLDRLAGRKLKDFPILFIRGGGSFYIQESDVRLIQRIFPLAQMVTIKQAGHWLHAEQPHIFSETIKQFLIQ